MSDKSTICYGINNPRPLPDLSVLRSILRIATDSPSGLRWNVRTNPRAAAGSVAGYFQHRGYWQVGISGSPFQSHRIVWMLHTGEDPGRLQIDHADGNRGNNDPSNLRLATVAQNAWNSGRKTHLSSLYCGVSHHARAKKWQAKIKQHGKEIYLGIFQHEHHAARAYDRAAIRHHGEFARLNFPLSDYIETH